MELKPNFPQGGEEIRSRKRRGSEPAAGGDAAQLVREAEEEQAEAAGGEPGAGRKMDISLLRERYRWTTERQRHQTQVLLFRQVSEELSEAVSIIPVTQGLLVSSSSPSSSPWEPDSSSAAASPPDVTSDLDPMTFDPWHVHLGLHRRSQHSATLQLPPLATTNPGFHSSSRRSSSVSEASSSRQPLGGRKLVVADSASDSSCSREISPSSSFSSTKGDHLSSSLDSNKADPAGGFSPGATRVPILRSLSGSKGDGVSASLESSDTDPGRTRLYGSLDTSEKNSSPGSREDHIDCSSGGSRGCSADDSFSSSVAGSLTSSDESSTPVVSATCSTNTSTTNLDEEEVKKNKPADARNGSAPVLRSSRKSSAPALRLARQLSFGGVQPQGSLGSSGGPSQLQHYYPFPHRKTPRKSEAARRLGMYSSF
ncbi:uncharacterized protein LOC115378740 isoform X2 [Myripristis murdjan]|uniref:uncharacterized protein LOC115378740 isoform X2 n=1 Tax=Myripristis murdjan TaxID=586833 RepID=UPI0011763790|nr:uncharacterized protein LOC115378740 isoform X2 [Myripristis murdjan]